MCVGRWMIGTGAANSSDSIFLFFLVYMVITNYHMFFLFIFLFFQKVYGYNHLNCTEDKHPTWLCNYMHEHEKVYSGHAELNLRKIKLT